MKLWPFNRPELRDSNYTDVVTQGLLSQASGEVTAGLTSAVEICSGWWGRAFSSAEVRPRWHPGRRAETSPGVHRSTARDVG